MLRPQITGDLFFDRRQKNGALLVTTETRQGTRQPDKSKAEREFSRIKEGLKANQAKIAESLRQRVGTGDWKVSEIDCQLDNGKEKIDMVFSAPDGKKEKFIIVDISIPHLGVGQKYGLPGKAKLFQKEREVSALRIKKAIILIRKGTESVSTQPGRIRCPIIEVQLENIVKPEPVEKPAEKPATNDRNDRNNRSNRDNRSNQSNRRPENNAPQSQAGETAKSAEAKVNISTEGVSQDLLFALKEAIVHECLSTMHKRCNKYIRKGLWRWIEREIMDPNIHFFLIILSSIYQGKTGEILSRRFKAVEDYSGKPEEIIAAIFSKENNLADEIKKDSERHRRALTKFLVCFSQTPPFEYLKSVFLKDFRSYNDGLRARMSVYSTLEQLLDRCGFEGEKETRYPLEILDELKIFQGIMTGNYTLLRTDNASKKLKHLVPQVEWTNEDIYSLRNQLAKALNLPSQEFNLNAFLPQAFFQDAKIMAESRKEAIRLPSHHSRNNSTEKQPAQEAIAAKEPAPETQQQPQAEARPSRRDRKTEFFERRKAEKLARQQAARPTISENTPEESGEGLVAPENDAEEPALRPISAKNLINTSQRDSVADSSSTRDFRAQPQETDEARHRYFENFGGHPEEDSDAIKLALAMLRHEREKAEQSATRHADNASQEDMADSGELEDNYRPPLKPTPGQVAVNAMPPRRPARPGTTDGQTNGNNRQDRKRRFSRNSPNRNKGNRRPGHNGVNR